MPAKIGKRASSARKRTTVVSGLEQSLTEIDSSIREHERYLSDLRALRAKVSEALAQSKAMPQQAPKPPGSVPALTAKATPPQRPDDSIVGWYSHCDKQWH